MVFAYFAINEVEIKKEGRVVFLERQALQYLNIDKICLYLDGTIEKQTGCPSSTPSAVDIAKTGEAKSISAKNVLYSLVLLVMKRYPFMSLYCHLPKKEINN